MLDITASSTLLSKRSPLIMCTFKQFVEKILYGKDKVLESPKKKHFSSVAILAQSRLSLITEHSNAYSFIHVLSIGHDFLLLMSA